MIGLFTTDIPPLPLNVSDTMRVTFRIENNVFGAGTRFQIVDAELTGGDLAHAHEGQDPLPQVLTVSTEAGDYVYELSTGQAKVYVLRSVLLFVPLAQLRKYVKE
jgi:hypothetical protein